MKSNFLLTFYYFQFNKVLTSYWTSLEQIKTVIQITLEMIAFVCLRLTVFWSELLDSIAENFRHKESASCSWQRSSSQHGKERRHPSFRL